MTVEPEGREYGTIVSMGHYGLGGFGHIQADNGDTLAMFYWSIIEGFHTLRAGQRWLFVPTLSAAARPRVRRRSSFGSQPSPIALI